ncbi:hypothetical protein ACLK1G_09985 [Pseudomonas sp. NR3]|uniref:hypothetical protein n=1 Tax=Pseudomonas sp. NR3 TaxID=3155978 RepID=UPI003B683F85
MLNDKDSTLDTLLIEEVREATFDPVSGESVPLALKVVRSPDRVAAAEVAVLFAPAGQEPISIKTNGEGWANYTYTANDEGDKEVVASLDGLEDGPTHTFHLNVLAAGFWGGAMFQFDGGEAEEWGKTAGFPRISQSHTVKFKADPEGPLKGREFCLGLTGYSSVTELGVTVTPELGIYRPLPANGELEWSFNFTGQKGGAFGLKLASPRILKHSPMNVMSLAAGGTTELEVKFDQFALPSGPSHVYPCHGATHTITVRPAASGSPMDEHVRLMWEGATAESLGVEIRPSLESTQLLRPEGVTWELDFANTTLNSDFSLQVQVMETGIITAPITMALAHNLVTTVHEREGPFPAPVGGSFWMESIVATSAHLRTPVAGVLVNNAFGSSGSTDSSGLYRVKVSTDRQHLSITNRYDGSVV